MKRFINNMLCLCCLALPAGLPAQTAPAPAAKDYPACLAAWDGRLRTLQTGFIQTSEYDGLPISRSEGRIYYEKAGPKLRLDNVEEGTVTQTALTNQKQIYILDEKGKEISKISWQDWLAGQPNQALFDFGHYGALLARHSVGVGTPQNGTVRLRLTPKTKTDDYVLSVDVGEEDCFPRVLSLESDLMKTTAVLTDTKQNAALDQTLFKGLK